MELETGMTTDTEPNMRHPKIQSLIASDARNKIVIDLIWQLIDNPECELTSMDMEYYSSIHEILKNRLTLLTSKQPLTHDQILSLWQQFEFPEKLKVVAFARAIEEAHGIGDSDDTKDRFGVG